MTSRRNARGFSLIELVIAVSLSSIVLLGLFSLMASMVQTQVQAARSGTVTAWSLASINQMNMQLAGASTIIYPSPNNSGETLVFCSNWTNLTSPPQAVNPNATVTAYYYCFDTGAHVLRYLYQAGCPNWATFVPPSCDAATYSGGQSGIVATGFYLTGAQPPFSTEKWTKVHLIFKIGNPAAGVSAGGGTESLTNPQSIPFDTRIILEG